jgi:hypothetical protein
VKLLDIVFAEDFLTGKSLLATEVECRRCREETPPRGVQEEAVAFRTPPADAYDQYRAASSLKTLRPPSNSSILEEESQPCRNC